MSDALLLAPKRKEAERECLDYVRLPIGSAMRVEGLLCIYIITLSTPAQEYVGGN